MPTSTSDINATCPSNLCGATMKFCLKRISKCNKDGLEGQQEVDLHSLPCAVGASPALILCMHLEQGLNLGKQLSSCRQWSSSSCHLGVNHESHNLESSIAQMKRDSLCQASQELYSSVLGLLDYVHADHPCISTTRHRRGQVCDRAAFIAVWASRDDYRMPVRSSLHELMSGDRGISKSCLP